jgi:predicted enzyme related to lactoylglutathione lyase
MTESNDKHPPDVHAFCWNELNTRDMSVAGPFYSELFQWERQSFSQGGLKCTMFVSQARHVAGMVAYADEGTPPPWLYGGADAPTQWISYVQVKDVDATLEKAVRLGARIAMPAKNTPGVGRIAVFQDPQGALLGVFAPLQGV